MHIVFIYDSITWGGMQTWVYNLIKSLRGKSNKISWLYIYGEDFKNNYSETIDFSKIGKGYRGKDYIYRPWKLIAAIYDMVLFLKKNPTDLIISGSSLGSLIAGFSGRILNIPCFRILGNDMEVSEPIIYNLYRICKFDIFIDRYFGVNAQLNQLLKKGVKPHKLVNINNAVDTNYFYPFDKNKKLKIKSELGYNQNDIIIGWIGRIAINMQVKYTVKLFEKLYLKNPKIFKLLIVGGGPWLEELKVLISEKEFASSVQFLGWQPLEKINSYYNVMDFVPLLEKDPWGGSIVREAMAVGSITISVDGISRVQKEFMNGEHAFLVSPNNFIEDSSNIIIELCKDKSKVEYISKKAREYACKNLKFDLQAEIIYQTFLKFVSKK